jgi:hypothetical protein
MNTKNFNPLTKGFEMSTTSTYKVTPELVLYTVLDTKTLNKLAKQYKKQVDKAFNEEEQIKARNAKVKIGKEFLVPTEDNEDLPEDLNLEKYVAANMRILKNHGLQAFLDMHGWTMEKLCDYFTKSSNLLKPISSISFS